MLTKEQAKLAWANGEQLQWKDLNFTNWNDLDGDHRLRIFEDEVTEFRIKPRTISINGIEIPAPFEPKKGDRYWYLAQNGIGYSSLIINHSGDSSLGIGCWKSEDDIKQVVAALRSIFNESHNNSD